MSDNPLDAVARFRDRLEQEARKLGLKMLDHDLKAGQVGGPHLFVAVFGLDDTIPDTVEEAEGDPALREQFEELMRQEAEHERQQAARAAEERAKSILGDLNDPSKGIL